MYCDSTSIGDETGTALAGALKGNAVLQSLTLTFSGGMSDETGTARAGALKDNAVLQSLEAARLSLSISMVRRPRP